MIGFLNDFLWGSVLIYVLIPVGLWFTIQSRFVQARHFIHMFSIFREAFGKGEDGKPTSFQALALSVAGRVGAGNIAGVAVAISLGGPGAIFWMWVVGLVGMATSFFECTLAQAYKRLEPDTGTYRGGPAYYIKHGLSKRLGKGAIWLAGLYSILLLVTFGFAFSVLQSYAISASMADAFSVPPIATGLVLATVIALVIFGGINRITAVTEYVVPIMAVIYIVMVVFVIAMNIGDLPSVFSRIFAGAFGLDAAIGGGIGAAVTNGVRRGLFSNEAGLGSAPNVAAVAHVRHPARQGVVQALSVFIDTMLICTCTASIILLSDIQPMTTDLDGVVLTQNALADHIGDWAQGFIAFALLLFVFSSIMYNYFLGENALSFFSRNHKLTYQIFRVATLGFIVVGATIDFGSAFAFADLTMGVLALTNLFALVLLFPIGLRLMRDFDGKARGGNRPEFVAGEFPDLDLDRAAWPVQAHFSRKE